VFYPTTVLDYHRLQFGAPIAMVGATTISVYVKQIGSDYRVGINATGYVAATVIFSLVGAGSVIGAVGGTAPNRAATITKVTDDGWYRITLTGTYTAIASVYVFMTSSTSTDPTGLNFTGVVAQGVAIWGLQINPGSTAQTYYPTTTTAYHAPRFDYSPTNIGEPRGLLIEGQSINLALNSSTFSSSTYTIQGSTLGTGSSNDPSNTANAIKLTSDAGTSPHLIYSTVGVANATSYTLSIYAKANGYNRIGVCIAAGGRYTAVFNLTGSGSFQEASSTASPAPTGTSYAITAIGTNGWYRCSVTMTTADTTLYPHFMVVNDGAITFNVYAQALFAGDASKSIYIWGAQLEAGSGASSYIPTGASQVTRNADNCSMYDTTLTGSLSWLKNATQGTFFVEATKRFSGNAAVNFAGALFGTEGTATKDFMLYQAIGTNWLSFNWGSDNITNYSALSAPFLIKAAVALSAGTPAPDADNMVSINGTNSALNTASTIALPLTNNLFCIGGTGVSGGSVPSQSYADATIRKIKFFPTALTAAQLNALTAP
jgi:hypothetical protein